MDEVLYLLEGRSGGNRLNGFRTRLSGEVNMAADSGAFLDREARRSEIAVENGGLAKFDASAGKDIAVDGTEHEKVANMKFGRNLGMRADGKARFGEVNRAFKNSVEIKIFCTAQFSAYSDRLSDVGGTFGWLHGMRALPVSGP
jgi:hypothetical protein